MARPSSAAGSFSDLPAELRGSLRAAASRLAHDVGKYLARTARNLPPHITAPIDAALLDMLCRDLYGAAPQADRPALLFAKLSAPIAAQLGDPRLARAAEMFSELAALEEKVRSGELAAVERACGLAREVEQLLRALARDAAEGAR